MTPTTPTRDNPPLHVEGILGHGISKHIVGPRVPVTEQDDTSSSEDEDESSQLYDLANSILQECKDRVPLSDLDTAINLFREALDRRPAPHPLRSDSLKDLAGALAMRFSLTNQSRDLDQAVLLCGEIWRGWHDAWVETGGQFQLDSDPSASELSELAKTTLIKLNRLAQLTDLNRAVALHREALLLRPSPHHQRLVSLGGLAATLYARFRCTDDKSNLDEAISLLCEAVEACPESHACRVDLLNNLSTVLAARLDKTGLDSDLQEAMTRSYNVVQVTDTNDERQSNQNEIFSFATRLLDQFEQSGQITELEAAISLFREGLALLPVHHPIRLLMYNNLANALTTRFKQSGQQEDLDEAISFHREALELVHTFHPDRSSLLNNLANALRTQFEQSGQKEDLDEAVSLQREALELVHASHPNRSGLLSNLANALSTQFSQLGQREDLDEAILFYRKALDLRPAPHPRRSYSLNNLAGALTTHFEQSGQQEALDESISLYREALELRPAPHPDRSSSLNGIATTLTTQFEQSGQCEHLDEAIAFHREALELQPASHPHRSTSLNNIASTLTAKFEQSGQWKDLAEAIVFYREAIELQPAPHPDRSMSLSNLANALRIQFEQSGQREDLIEAIFLHREALELVHASHPNRSGILANLATTLRIQFEQSGQREELDEAILFYREALELQLAPHPDRPSSLNGLANALTTQFHQSGQREALDESISFYRDALELRPAPHPDRSGHLNNLASAIDSRFDQWGQREDLYEAVNVYHESLDALVSGHPSTCRISANLGRTLLKSYSHTHEAQYLDKAMAAFRTAVTCEASPASERFRVAKLWAHHADSTHESALDAYLAAIELLPRLAMFGLDLQKRQQVLTSGSDGLARDAAACAIRSGQYEMALELLEAGRAVFWSQALQLRTPMTKLREKAPGLAEKLRHISFALEQGSLRDTSRSLSDTSRKMISMDKEASRFRRLNDEWLATLEEVRQLDGFQDFLRPSRLYVLQRAAINGPLVVLIPSSTGCAAIILTLTDIQHVPLPDVNVTVVAILVKLLRYAISQDGRDASLPESSRAHVKVLIQQLPNLPHALQLLRIGRASVASPQTDDIFRCVLAVLWLSVVEPVIRSLALKKSENPTRLWWCPTGPFSFLPIHAAGLYLVERTECIFDYVISSYTPTISTLLSDIPLSADTLKMMVVIQTDTPNQKSLPYTLDELRKIEAHVPDKALVKLVPGSVKDVTLNLPATSIAHFACHGQQNTQNPLESALLLQDGHLKVSHIMQQSMPNASLAFLSACETAMGDENLPDEVIHLGATLLFAGFRGVVATMWSISDVDGPKVADTFYEKLFKASDSTAADASGPDTTQAARALHHAVAKLRSENVPFVRWVPFIHLGR